MQRSHPVLDRLARGENVFLQGAVGDELLRKGYAPADPLRDAAAARDVPETLLGIYRAYVQSGVDIVCAHTANSSVRALARGGIGMRAAALTSRAVDLAVEAAASSGRTIAIAGVLGSLEDPLRRGALPSARTLADEHAEQSHRLEASGCDLVVVQAMPTLVETIAATSAARRHREHVWVHVRVGPELQADIGPELARVVQLVVASGATALILDGDASVDIAGAVAAVASLALGVPIGIAPDAADEPAPRAVERLSAVAAKALQRGARIVAGGRDVRPDVLRSLLTNMRVRAAA